MWRSGPHHLVREGPRSRPTSFDGNTARYAARPRLSGRAVCELEDRVLFIAFYPSQFFIDMNGVRRNNREQRFMQVTTMHAKVRSAVAVLGHRQLGLDLA